MQTRLDGKTAIVTGAARGLGFGIARRLAVDGARVTLVDIDESVAGSAVELGATGCVIDVSVSGAIDAVVGAVIAEHGRLDIMVANAGIGGGGPIAEMSDELYRRIVAVNLDGVFYACRAAANAMTPQQAGSIVTVGSVFGRDTPAGSGVYGATKAGVIALTHALARELAPVGVRVNCISPGHMGTELYWKALQRRASATGRSYEETVAAELAQVPMGRFGTGEDAGSLVAFLASDDASYITGQTINVDGGLQPI